jgi:hypothetical protein
MNEENMMDDETPQTARCKSAFFGTSNEERNRNPKSKTERYEVFTAHAIPYNRSFMFYVPKRLIPSHEHKDDVIELWIAHGKRPSLQFPLYTTHYPTSRRAIVSLFQIGVKHKHRLLINKIGLYDLGRFVQDYNARRPKGLEDVALEWTDSKLKMRINGVEIDLGNSGLRAYQGEAVLDLGIDGRDELRLRRGIRGFRVLRSPGKETVTTLRARRDALIVKYRNSKKWKGESMRFVDLPRKHVGVLDSQASTSEMRLISSPKSFEGDYMVELPENLEKDARDKMRIADSPAEYFTVKGEIGETIADRILRLANCIEIANHPASKSKGYRNSEKKGPDSLRLVPGVGTAYFESKWWKQFNMAVWEARQRVREYCNRYPGPDGQRIENGYAAVLDWQIGSLIARLYVEKVV